MIERIPIEGGRLVAADRGITVRPDGKRFQLILVGGILVVPEGTIKVGLLAWTLLKTVGELIVLSRHKSRSAGSESLDNIVLTEFDPDSEDHERGFDSPAWDVRIVQHEEEGGGWR